MKLTNLYNYDGIKSFAVKPQIKLDCASVISNAGYAEDDSEELFQPGIYDSAKENRAYLDLVVQLGLANLSLEELMQEELQFKIEDYSVSRPSSNKLTSRQTKLWIKVNYILRKINSYWPNHVDKYLVLYNWLFVGQSYERVACNFGVEINSIKSLVLDFRKLWRLYKSQLVSNNVVRKLRSEHFEFISQFII